MLLSAGSILACMEDGHADARPAAELPGAQAGEAARNLGRGGEEQMSGNSFIAMVGMILILLFVIMQLGPLISVWFY